MNKSIEISVLSIQKQLSDYDSHLYDILRVECCVLFRLNIWELATNNNALVNSLYKHTAERLEQYDINNFYKNETNPK
jgi:hypothetical protein